MRWFCALSIVYDAMFSMMVRAWRVRTDRDVRDEERMIREAKTTMSPAKAEVSASREGICMAMRLRAG
jgi:hypothetical protein